MTLSPHHFRCICFPPACFVTGCLDAEIHTALDVRCRVDPNRESRLRFSAMPSFRVPSAEAGCRLWSRQARVTLREQMALMSVQGATRLVKPQSRHIKTYVELGGTPHPYKQHALRALQTRTCVIKHSSTTIGLQGACDSVCSQNLAFRVRNHGHGFIAHLAPAASRQPKQCGPGATWPGR